MRREYLKQVPRSRSAHEGRGGGGDGGGGVDGTKRRDNPPPNAPLIVTSGLSSGDTNSLMQVQAGTLRGRPVRGVIARQYRDIVLAIKEKQLAAALSRKDKDARGGEASTDAAAASSSSPSCSSSSSSTTLAFRDDRSSSRKTLHKLAESITFTPLLLPRIHTRTLCSLR